MDKSLQPNQARGGTELMADRINTLPPELLSRFQIIHSRVRELDPTKKRILVLHDLPGDPEVEHLKNGGWAKFDTLVFVSHWQQHMYNAYLGVPYGTGVVMQNAITPFVHPDEAWRYWPQDDSNQDDVIRLMYFSTPHRGLELLLPSYDKLYKKYGDKIELNVFSSFDLYGWNVRDEPYMGLFEKLKAHPGINYSKSVSNEVIRAELDRSHILAYPSIWQETSCLVLIEAMCAGLTCVHSSLGALPETAMGHTYMYDYTEDTVDHIERFTSTLEDAIEDVSNGITMTNERKDFLNECYSWNNRSLEWQSLLTSLL
jgi:glycosyltransferase involved in cell wall biosynthesis